MCFLSRLLVVNKLDLWTTRVKTTMGVVQYSYEPDIDVQPVIANNAGCNFYTYLWPADKSVTYKGRVIVLHGYRDNYPTFFRFFNLLIKQGYDVFYYWQRGEGETKLENDEQGYAEDSKVYSDLDYMVEYNLEELKKEGKENANLVLLGHSMGGGISMNYSISGKYRHKFKCITTTAPLILLDDKTKPPLATEYLVRFLCFALPFTKSMRVKTPLNINYLSSDPKTLHYLNTVEKPADLGTAFVEARDFIMRGRKLLETAVYSKYDNKVPILICHGDDDHINSIEGSRQFVQNLNKLYPESSNEVKLISIKDGKHCLLADRDDIYEETANSLLAFYNKYCS